MNCFKVVLFIMTFLSVSAASEMKDKVQYKLSIKIDTESDAWRWADPIGDPEPYVVVDGLYEKSYIIPFRAHMQQGETTEVFYGLDIKKGNIVIIRVYDDDGTGFSAGASSPVQIDQDELIKDDFIGGAEVEASTNSAWEASGNILDVYKRKIGEFSLRKIDSESEIVDIDETSGSAAEGSLWTPIWWVLIVISLLGVIWFFHKSSKTPK